VEKGQIKELEKMRGTLEMVKTGTNHWKTKSRKSRRREKIIVIFAYPLENVF